MLATGVSLECVGKFCVCVCVCVMYLAKPAYIHPWMCGVATVPTSDLLTVLKWQILTLFSIMLCIV